MNLDRINKMVRIGERTRLACRRVRPALAFLFASALLTGTASNLFASGEDNPGGVTGMYSNGFVTTGSGYSPYTGCVHRSLMDISVHGGVGYPLSFTRTSNSRGSSVAPAFGAAGSWTHNWQWSIDPLTLYGQSSRNAVPTYYNVRYPDGRVINFGPVHQNGDPDYHGSLGVRDRMEPVPGHSSGTQNCYVRLPDGGKVWFIAVHDNDPGDPDFGPYTVTWTYQIAGLIDPYGQLTTIALNSDGISGRITEPAGRYLQIYGKLGPALDTVVDKVEEHLNGATANRTVAYNYTLINFGGTNYSCLTSVTNYDGTTSVYTYQASNISPGNGRPLLKTCVDPMYPGPMWMIAYIYSGSTIYGQLLSENYYNGAIGAAVSTLTIGSNTRTEARGDGPTRTFTYTGYQLTGVTDFKGVGSAIAYDTGGFPNAVTDFNGNTTNFTSNAFNGAQLTATYPLTASDTLLGLGRASSSNVFGSSSCPDVNNRDGNNPYYLYSTANKPRRHRKRGFGATYLRDTSKRVTTITYLDGGTETFTYNTFGQVLQHRLKSGGLEVYDYDARGLLTAYHDPYHLAVADPQNPTVPTSSTPSLAYTYFTSGVNQDMANTVIDGNNVVTTFTYNARGQVLTTKIGSVTVATNVYNTNGTLATVTDERGKQTSYTYDDYKRLLTTKLPPPNGGASPPPTYIGYNPNSNTTYTDYTHTDSNPRVTLPPPGGSVSSKTSPYMTQIVYDNNYRKTSVIVSPGADSDPSWDEAKTTYTYDNNGNLKTIKDPNNNKSGGTLVTTNYYDQQNRLTDVDDRMVNDAQVPHKNSNGHAVSYTYDQANNVLTTRKTNNGLITNVYDAMNHVTKMTVGQAPTADAVTNNTYYPSGLLHTMQDPKLNTYTYTYDLMGRKSSLAYPTGGGSEAWSYDPAGNLGTFTNRDSKVQTFNYDNRERSKGFSWNDSITPNVTITITDTEPFTIKNDCAYPAARTITVTDIYNDDGTLRSEDEISSAEGIHRMVSYAYFQNLKLSSVTYPGSPQHIANYSYTPRGVLYGAADNGVGYRVNGFDHNENLTSFLTGPNGIQAVEQLNAMDEMTHYYYYFPVSGGNITRWADYGYDKMNDRTSIARDGGAADTFGYDLNEQSTTATQGGVPSTFTYDANGNRNDNTNYVVNSLNQYTKFNGTTISYDNKGNVTGDGNGTYIYDAQNRMTSATVGGLTTTFLYDGYNRKFSQTISNPYTTTVNVWNGWNLIEECNYGTSTPTYTYFHGIDGIEERLGGSTSPLYYFHDALGSVTHVTDASGNLKEWYKYDRFGAVTLLSATNTQLSTSAYDIRHLFTNQLWMPQVGLYDYRNRVYSPVLQRFLQTDPIGFGGDASHLYRYAGNNVLNGIDPTGLLWGEAPALGGAAVGAVYGTLGGLGYGIGSQIYSSMAGNGWDWGAVASATAKGAFWGGVIGGISGAIASGDPTAVLEVTTLSYYGAGAALATGLGAAAAEAHSTTSAPSQANQATPPATATFSYNLSAPDGYYQNGDFITPSGEAIPRQYGAGLPLLPDETPLGGKLSGFDPITGKPIYNPVGFFPSGGGGVGNPGGTSGFGTSGSGSPFAGLSFSSPNAAIAYVFWGGSTMSRIPPERPH